MKAVLITVAALLCAPACADAAKPVRFDIEKGPDLELRMLSRMQEICGSRADGTRERLAGRPENVRRACIASLTIDPAADAEMRAAFEAAKKKL